MGLHLSATRAAFPAASELQDMQLEETLQRQLRLYTTGLRRTRMLMGRGHPDPVAAVYVVDAGHCSHVLSDQCLTLRT